MSLVNALGRSVANNKTGLITLGLSVLARETDSVHDGAIICTLLLSIHPRDCTINNGPPNQVSVLLRRLEIMRITK